jgi:hypothetical protein
MAYLQGMVTEVPAGYPNDIRLARLCIKLTPYLHRCSTRGLASGFSLSTHPDSSQYHSFVSTDLRQVFRIWRSILILRREQTGLQDVPFG